MNDEYEQIFSGDWSDAENHSERAHDLYDNGMWLHALKELETAVAINPNNSDWFFNMGITLDTLDRYHDAIEAFQTAHELNPDDREGLNCLGIDYTRIGEYDRALRVFEELEQVAGDFEPGYCNRIITYAEMGRHEDAEAMFYLARQLTEHCPLCYFNIGNSLFARGLYDRAIWCWRQTRQLTPSHPQIDYRIGLGYWAKGDHQQASEYFLGELRRRPGDVDVLLDMGILSLEMNELDSAREKFHRILELQPQHAQTHHYLGELSLHEGNLHQAVELFSSALSLNPHQPGSHYRLGECFWRLEQEANAREHLMAEARFLPENIEVLLDLGCLLEEVGERNEAMSCFERAIELEPDDPRGYQNLSIVYYDCGLIEQGVDLSEHVLKLQASHVGALQNLAYAHLQKGDFEQAGKYVMLAGKVEPGNGELHDLRRKIKVGKLVRHVKGPLQRIRRSFGRKVNRMGTAHPTR